MKIVPHQHTGTVLSVYGDEAEVELDLTCTSACSGCRLSTLCKGDGSKSRIRTRVLPSAGTVAAGSRVKLAPASGTARTATVRLLCVPLLAFVGVLIALSWLGMPDYISAAAGVGAMLVCFGGVYIMGRHEPPEWIVTEAE